ncbi:MAG: porin family protein [Bacteroides sp.]|nr:porin family protein [Bacteroides sp.]
MILRNLFIFMAAAVSLISASAQEAKYKWDVGVAAGMSGYIGDANGGFPFRHPGAAVSVLGRYNFNTRLALRAQAGLQTISGNTADMDNVLPGNAQYKFNTSVFDFGVKGEFNFFPYGIGETYKRLRRCTPYATVGIGVAVGGSKGNGAAAFALPLGVGVKYKLSERCNLGAEWTFTKTFSDKIDSKELTDLYLIKSSFIKNTDWLSTLTVSITYEFGERCEVCNRKD